MGVWSYNDTPLEGVFMEATATDAEVEKLVENIVAMCRELTQDTSDLE